MFHLSKMSCDDHPGCSLAIGDWRILWLLHKILQLKFVGYLRELCPPIITLLIVYSISPATAIHIKCHLMKGTISDRDYILTIMARLLWNFRKGGKRSYSTTPCVFTLFMLGRIVFQQRLGICFHCFCILQAKMKLLNEA